MNLILNAFKEKNFVLYLVNCFIKRPASDMYLVFSEGLLSSYEYRWHT